MPLLILLIAVPILEIALFLQVGDLIGFWPTIAIVIATAIAGTVLLRTQGFATMSQLQSSVAEGRNPMNPIAHGALILIAGVLLLTPGFFTDAIGFLFLIPPIRATLIKAGAAKFAAGKIHVRTNAGEWQQEAEPRSNPDQPKATIDGEFTIIDEDATPGNSGWTRPKE